MLKQVRVPFDDIVFDPEEVGDMLTACLRRQRKMRFVGAAAAEKFMIAVFEDSPVRSGSRLVLAPLKNSGPEELSAEISQRFEHNYLLRSSFRIRSGFWALYEVVED